MTLPDADLLITYSVEPSTAKRYAQRAAAVVLYRFKSIEIQLSMRFVG